MNTKNFKMDDKKKYLDLKSTCSDGSDLYDDEMAFITRN